MTQEQRITLAVQAIGTDVKTLLGNQGILSTLTTTQKLSLVGAINEVNTALSSATSGGVTIDDNATTSSTKTYSIDKITANILQLKNDLLGGVPATAFDTLKEIADYIGTDQTATSGLVTAIGLRVAVDSAQTFTTAQQIQGRANIAAYGAAEIGNPDTDFVTIYNTAKS